MADGFEIAKAYVTIIPSFKDGQTTIAKELGAVTDSASKDAGEKSGKTFGENLAKGLKATAGVIAGAMAVATGAAVATGKAFINSAKDTAAYGDEVDKTSQKMGLSAKAYQEWDYVMKIAGTEMSSMTTGLKTLTNKLDDAKNGSESAQAMFGALGISMEDIATMSREDLFERTIAGLQGMEESTERAALANDLFGKSGQNLAPLFNMSAEETQNLIDKANEYGMVLSDDGVKASAKFTDSMTTMQNTMTGLKNNMMSQFLPSLTKITDGISGVISGKGDKGAIQEGIKGLVGNITSLAPTFLALASAIILGLLDGFAPMLPELITGIFNFLNQAILMVVSLIPQLLPSIILGIQGIMSAIFQSLPIIIDSLIKLVNDLVVWFASDGVVSEFIDGIVKMTAQIANSIAMILPVLLPAIVTIIAELAKALTAPDNVELLLDAVLTTVGAIFVALVNCVPELINLVVGVLENLGELLGRFFDWIVPIVANVIEKIVDTVKSWGNNIKNFITNLITSIKDGFTSWLDNLKSGFTNAFTMIKDKVSTIIDKVKSLVTNVINTIKELPSKVVSIGKNLIEGLWNGINDKIQWVKDKISKMGSQITNAIKKVFGIASPSKVWKKEVGAMLAQGIGIGFSDEMDTVVDDMQKSMDGLTGNMTASVRAYGTATGMIADETNTYYGGNITVNVYGAEGQDVDELAKQVAYELEEQKNRKAVVYA